MKKRIFFPVLALVLLLSLAFSAGPVMGGTVLGMTLSISASPAQVDPGDSTQLTITLQNVGSYRLEDVSLTVLSYTLIPVSGIHNWTCVVGDSDIYLEPGEVWTWQVDTPPIDADTPISVTGTGHLYCGTAWTDSATVVVCIVPPPPCDFEGLTPGYWKNHLEDWTGYAPTDNFHAVFGVGPELTLLQVVKKGGGGEIALGRHAIAALLNAAHPNIDYPLTVNEVIAAVQQAYATGGFESVKNNLESYNELEGDIDT